MDLNERAEQLCQRLVERADELRIEVTTGEAGTRIIDCGVAAGGGLAAGLGLASVCMADLGTVELVPGDPWIWSGPAVAVATDHPVAACMAAQYAGWQVTGENFFGMGSGPMRAAAGREDLFDDIGHLEQPDVAVGVLETSQLPPAEVCVDIAAACRVPPDKLTLLVARTASQAGTVQVVVRSVETACHKLHELGFHLSRLVSGYGVAPLPPVASEDLDGIGRTNDAVLYGARVTLWVRGDDASLEAIGERVPSSASRDHGEPFATIFARYDHDFYAIDPHLFSPAWVSLNNLETGSCFEFGELRPDVLEASFGGA